MPDPGHIVDDEEHDARDEPRIGGALNDWKVLEKPIVRPVRHETDQHVGTRQRALKQQQHVQRGDGLWGNGVIRCVLDQARSECARHYHDTVLDGYAKHRGLLLRDF